ncbi:hypothetical protein X739_24325 [Mesorhizobium sp. LNHC220B00]|nr:hypothetical protein [Mesorhizobium sp. LNHC220B00]ESY83417.1 hypothetical protein X739_24325 [Mesorhizobium sp. LNHC220B00]
MATPAVLPNTHESQQSFDPSRPQDADEVWRQFVQKDFLGANMQDHDETGDKKTSRH